MKISIGDATMRHMKTLGIEIYPFSADELKSKFTHLIKKHHPDVNGNSDVKNAEKTRLIIEANTHLKNLCRETLDSLNDDVVIDDEDDDIFILKEKCNECKGKGSTIQRQWVEDKCPDCNGSRKVILSCQRCNGVGYREPKKINKCPQCKGSGEFKKVTCWSCYGLKAKHQSRLERLWFGEQNVGHYKDVKVICSTCKGKGRVIVNPFNPVVRKGAVL